LNNEAKIGCYYKITYETAANTDIVKI